MLPSFLWSFLFVSSLIWKELVLEVRQNGINFGRLWSGELGLWWRNLRGYVFWMDQWLICGLGTRLYHRLTDGCQRLNDWWEVQSRFPEQYLKEHFFWVQARFRLLETW